MKAKWWHYIIMGATMLFIHPFLLFWDLLQQLYLLAVYDIIERPLLSSISAFLYAFARSIFVPLLVYILFVPTTPEQIYINGFIYGWWTWSYICSVANMTYNQVQQMRMAPVIEAFEHVMASDVKGEGDPETFKKAICDVVQDIYGKRPAASTILVEKNRDGIYVDVIHIAMENGVLPREAAIRITQELQRRKYERTSNS